MLYTATFFLLMVVAVLLIIVVLLQKGTSEFALAFGSNPMQSIFGGTEADTVLTKITYFLGALFLVLSLLLAVMSKSQQEELLKKLQTTEQVQNQNSTF
ncbi:MAG: preprotein translocase subunit SecG [Aquificae bacterium]|nr:preprotein translocase subunit SecG [Aquificota bacterium]